MGDCECSNEILLPGEMCCVVGYIDTLKARVVELEEECGAYANHEVSFKAEALSDRQERDTLKAKVEEYNLEDMGYEKEIARLKARVVELKAALRGAMMDLDYEKGDYRPKDRVAELEGRIQDEIPTLDALNSRYLKALEEIKNELREIQPPFKWEPFKNITDIVTKALGPYREG